jgi:hypothetical protein
MEHESMDGESLETVHLGDTEPPLEEANDVAQSGTELSPLIRNEEAVKQDQRIVSRRLEDIDPSAPFEHARALIDDARRIRDVVENVTDDHVVECAFIERKRERRPDDEAAARDVCARKCDRVRVDVDADRSIGLAKMLERCPGAASDIENPLSNGPEGSNAKVALPLGDERSLRLPLEVFLNRHLIRRGP